MAVDEVSVPRSDLRRLLPTRSQVRTTGIVAAAVVGAKVLADILSVHHVVQASTPVPVVLLGAIIGMTYGLLAIGLIIVYRTTRIINFAHGQIGTFGAAIFGFVAVEWHFPYWCAFVIGIAVASMIGAGTEMAVIRRLRSAPRLMCIVATLGVAQCLLVVSVLINSNANSGFTYPEPSFLPSFNVGPLLVTPAYTGMLVLSPVVVLVIALFFKRTRLGFGMRAAADNPDAARMSGVYASRMSALAWAIAGALSGFTAMLTAPTQGFISGDTFGPELLLRAMTIAVIARMRSMPVALAGGIGLGILEQVLLWNYPNSGLVEVVLFVVIMVALLVQPQRRGRDEDKGSWAAVQGPRPVPERLREVRLIRMLPFLVAASALAVLASLPLFITESLSIQFTGIIALVIVGMSMVLLTGLGGQLTLGQFAVAAIGAVVSYQVFRHVDDVLVALCCAGLAAGIASVLIGLPSLRIRGLMLSVTTLGFALLVPAWLLSQGWMLGGGANPRKPSGWPLDGSLTTGHSYYYFALVVLAVVMVLTSNVRRSGFARLLVATRDNEDNARAFTVRASSVKLQAYLLSGFLAGIGGAVYGNSLSTISADTFPVQSSITVVVLTVLGGVSGTAGPILGAIWVLGLPLLNIGNLALAATNIGILLLFLWKPGGLVQLVQPVRDRAVEAIGRRFGADADPAGPVEDIDPPLGGIIRSAEPARSRGPSEAVTSLPAHEPLLSVRNVSRSYGGVHAVRDVSFDVAAGETVGLIGPNGAGKTTTFEILAGFTRPDAGRVTFAGRDISRMGPERRAKLGLIRSFQEATLFPTMTVQETVMVALERVQKTRFLTAAFLASFGERTKGRRARAIIAMMGLERYRDAPIQELSTGTRRITELACLVALEPVCLLLDEPSSGVAQRETERLGQLLEDLKRQLGVTLVVIEHDMPLITGIANRLIVMADGAVIADGPPGQVTKLPVVVDSYLGGSRLAQNRSGPTPGMPAGPARAPLELRGGSAFG